MSGSPSSLDIQHKIVIMPYVAQGDPEFGEVNALVSWLPDDNMTLGQKQLVEAFVSYVGARTGRGSYDACIVPANTAVEMALTPLIAARLKRDVSNKKVEQFLRAASYGHQLDVLLPVLTKTQGIPGLEGNVLQLLGELRAIRNQIGHTGRPSKALTEAIVSELLCAAVFGLAYTDILASHL
jgi:hypothetical protein